MGDYDIFKIIKERSDIITVAEHLGLNLNRKNMCKCFLHNEKTASLSINPKKQIWHCFGCNQGGDVISLVEKSLKCTPYEAIKHLNIICNCGINFEKDKSKPKFEYDKQYAKYKIEKEKEKKFSHEKINLYNQLFEAATFVYRFWHNLKLMSKHWNIELYGEYLSVIYKNEIYFEYIVDLFDNNYDFIYEIKDKLKTILERGIIYMDFDNIALIAFKKEEMPKSSSTIELLVYYMLKELYIKHYKKQINDEDAKLEKQKIKSFYDKQTSIENFDSKLRKQVADNIRNGEDEVISITKLINQNAEIKQICDIAISCISHLTDNVVLQRMYEEKYPRK